MQEFGMRQAALMCLLMSSALTLHADDGAASIAAGGIILMRREPRIVMAKEVLTISESKIVVDYDFRNESPDNIVTEVAFPIPAYVDDPDGPRWQLEGFDDFKLSIDGIPAHYQTETRAFVGTHDITRLLANLEIDAASFGHEHPDKQGNIINDLARLSRPQRVRLYAIKAIDGVDDLGPDWSVEKKYHWTQTFPPHGIVHVRHEYTPVVGNTNSASYGLLQAKESPEAAKELASICIDPSLRTTLLKYVSDQKVSVPVSFVDFILTTANTWKTPIEDFTLNVERVQAEGANKSFVSFCWAGPVQKPDSNHFTVNVKNLVPQKELRIGYIQVLANKPD